jgi:hypothetical protein
MTKKILVSYDFSQNEIQNVKIQNLASDPSSPVDGQIWFNTTTGKLMVRQGGANVDATARANHTGTQLAATISDLSTSVQATRLDQFAAPTAAVGLGGQRVTGLADPVAATDAATKGYVDAAVNGTDWKQSVRVATTGSITLSGLQTVDGISLVAGDRVLVKDQADAKTNGVYVAASGAWARSSDANSESTVTAGLSVMVEEGTVQADSQWRLITDGTIVLGTTSLTFAQIGAGTTYSAGAGISIVGNTVAVATGVVARKFSATIGGAVNSVVNHGLNNLDVTVQAYLVATGESVECDVVRNSTSQVTLGFSVAPDAASIRVVVIG